MFLVKYADDFHIQHLIVVNSLNELNFLRDRFDGNIISCEMIGGYSQEGINRSF